MSDRNRQKTYDNFRGTKAELASKNPRIFPGEIAGESDTGRLKWNPHLYQDQNWNDLQYFDRNYSMVADIAARDAIPAIQRVLGMVVTVQNEGMYRLENGIANSNWVPVGAGTPGTDGIFYLATEVERLAILAPVQDKIYHVLENDQQYIYDGADWRAIGGFWREDPIYADTIQAPYRIRANEAIWWDDSQDVTADFVFKRGDPVTGTGGSLLSTWDFVGINSDGTTNTMIRMQAQWNMYDTDTRQGKFFMGTPTRGGGFGNSQFEIGTSTTGNLNGGKYVGLGYNPGDPQTSFSTPVEVGIFGAGGGGAVLGIKSGINERVYFKDQWADFLYPLYVKGLSNTDATFTASFKNSDDAYALRVRDDRKVLLNWYANSQLIGVDANGVIYSNDAPSDGTYYARVSGAWVQFTPGAGGSSTLGGLTDVTLTSVADNDLLQYDQGTGKWVNVAIGNFGTFIGLSDTPANYSAQANKFLRVNATNDGVEFWDGSDLATMTWVNGQGFITTETDPVFTASAASGITAGDITNWNTAFGWGNHATAGYLTTLALGGLSNVTLTTPVGGDILRYNGSIWVNYPDSNYAASGHQHAWTDLTDTPGAHVARAVQATNDGGTALINTQLRLEDNTVTRYVTLYNESASSSGLVIRNRNSGGDAGAYSNYYQQGSVTKEPYIESSAFAPGVYAYTRHEALGDASRFYVDIQTAVASQTTYFYGDGIVLGAQLGLLESASNPNFNVQGYQPGNIYYNTTNQTIRLSINAANTWVDIADRTWVAAQGYLTALPSHAISNHSDVNITGAAANDYFRWSGSEWQNIALATVQSQINYWTKTGADLTYNTAGGSVTMGIKEVAHYIGGAKFYSGGGDNGGAFDGDYDLIIGEEAYDGTTWPNTGLSYHVNTGFGYGVFKGTTNVDFHIAIGGGAMRDTTADLSPFAGGLYTTGVSIGGAAGRDIKFYNGSVLIGSNAARYVNKIFRNTLIGNNVGYQVTTTNTVEFHKATAVGSFAAYRIGGMEHTILMGHEAGIQGADGRTFKDVIGIGDYVFKEGTVEKVITIGNFRTKGNSPVNWTGANNTINIGHFVQGTQQFTINVPLNYDMGLGTYTPGAKLDVKGEDDLGTTYAFIVRNDSGTEIFKIGNDGKVYLPQLANQGTIGTAASTGEIITGSAGGSSTFLGLSDTPGSYTSQGGKFVSVNSGGTALEFSDAPSDGTYYARKDGVWTTFTPGAGGSSTLGGLTDVTLTTPTTGDVLRYDGAEWVNYAGSNYASSTHTHTLLQLTDGPASYAGSGNFFLRVNAGETGFEFWDGSDIATQTWVTANFIQSETDPVFAASPASGITAGDITDWDTAFGWGNHSTQGYVKPVYTGLATNDLLRYNGTNWVNIPQSTFSLSGHTHTFTSGLSDTPANYVGSANYYVRVNGAATGLEFFDGSGLATQAWVTSQNYLTDAPSNGQLYARQNGGWQSFTAGASSWIGLSDTPGSLTAWAIYRGNSTGSALDDSKMYAKTISGGLEFGYFDGNNDKLWDLRNGVTSNIANLALNINTTSNTYYARLNAETSTGHAYLQAQAGSGAGYALGISVTDGTHTNTSAIFGDYFNLAKPIKPAHLSAIPSFNSWVEGSIYYNITDDRLWLTQSTNNTAKALAFLEDTYEWPTVTETGTSISLNATTHRRKYVLCTNAGAISVTLPNSFDTDWECVIVRANGAGEITLSATTTLYSDGTKLATAKTAATVKHVGSNVWYAFGPLTT